MTYCYREEFAHEWKETCDHTRFETLMTDRRHNIQKEQEMNQLKAMAYQREQEFKAKQEEEIERRVRERLLNATQQPVPMDTHT